MFEDLKRTYNTLTKINRAKRQTMLNKAIHRKLMIENQKTNKEATVDLDFQEGYTIPAPPVVPIVLSC